MTTSSVSATASDGTVFVLETDNSTGDVTFSHKAADGTVLYTESGSVSVLYQRSAMYSTLSNIAQNMINIAGNQ